MSTAPGRHHWLNTIVGILDSAFFLTDEEQYAVSDIVRKVLASLNIPGRGDPSVLPVPLAQEVSCGYYSLALSGPQMSGVVRQVRPVTDQDIVVSVEAWREAIVGMFTTAYPDISEMDRVMLTKVFHDLLAAIGAPNRAAAYFPDVVIAAHREVDPRI